MILLEKFNVLPATGLTSCLIRLVAATSGNHARLSVAAGRSSSMVTLHRCVVRDWLQVVRAVIASVEWRSSGGTSSVAGCSRAVNGWCLIASRHSSESDRNYFDR